MSNDSFVLNRSDIKQLCIAGSKAPSGGNAQPWKVVVRGNILDIVPHPTRSISFLDVGKYATFFALGAFLENLLIQAESMGLQFTTQIKYKKDASLFVRLVFTGKNNKQFAHTLLHSISKRVTNRQLYDGTIIDQKYIHDLEKSVKSVDIHNTVTCVSSYEKKKEIADTLGVADGIRMTNDKLYSQMMDEFRWSDEETNSKKDGLDLKTLEMPNNLLKMMRLMRRFPKVKSIIPRKAFEQMARPLILNCSHMCCLSCSYGYSPKAMFLGGQTMERLWLTATKLGFSIQPWSILPFFLIRVDLFKGEGFTKKEIETIKYLGKMIRKNFGLSLKDTPLFIFRLSKAKPPSARSLRVPWTQFTEIRK